MKFLGKYWKVLISLLLLGAAFFLYQEMYLTEKQNYENQVNQANTMISVLQSTIAENQKYAHVQEDIPAALEAIDSSRLALYEHFPVDMKEEDQIMHVLYLESVFGTEINFNFNDVVPLGQLQDGSILMIMPMNINYDTTYQGFQDMVKYLATDSRITSVNYASIDYDAENDRAVGRIQFQMYLIATSLRDYEAPNVPVPETGKDNIFD